MFIRGDSEVAQRGHEHKITAAVQHLSVRVGCGLPHISKRCVGVQGDTCHAHEPRWRGARRRTRQSRHVYLPRGQLPRRRRPSAGTARMLAHLYDPQRN
jgi:hypothetical protein